MDTCPLVCLTLSETGRKKTAGDRFAPFQAQARHFAANEFAERFLNWDRGHHRLFNKSIQLSRNVAEGMFVENDRYVCLQQVGTFHT